MSRARFVPGEVLRLVAADIPPAKRMPLLTELLCDTADLRALIEARNALTAAINDQMLRQGLTTAELFKAARKAALNTAETRHEGGKK